MFCSAIQLGSVGALFMIIYCFALVSFSFLCKYIYGAASAQEQIHR
jgi:hypothetical protein